MTIPPHVDAAEFIERLASLAQRLAARRIVVCTLDCDWGSSRSWELHAQQGDATERFYEAIEVDSESEAKGPDLLKCWWWGDKDRVLIIDEIPTSWLGSPNQWSRLLHTEFDSGESALAHVEAFLMDRLGS